MAGDSEAALALVRRVLEDVRRSQGLLDAPVHWASPAQRACLERLQRLRAALARLEGEVAELAASVARAAS